MQDLGLKTFNKLYPMMIKKYQDLIVDQNATEKDKINQIIQKLNALGKLSNDVVRDWNTVYQWTMNDGLTQNVVDKINQMFDDGSFNEIIDGYSSQITNEFNTQLDITNQSIQDAATNAQTQIDLINQNQVVKQTDYNTFVSQTNTSLAEKMTQDTTDIGIGQINPNKGKIPQSLLSDEVIAQMAGTAAVNAVPARKSVTLEKLSVLDVTNLNLHNAATDLSDHLVGTDGIIYASTGYHASDFIPIESGAQYYNSNALAMSFYDSNKNFIIGYQGGAYTNPYTAPANAKYVRHTYFNNESGVLCEGTSIIKANATYGDQIVNVNNATFEKIISDIANKDLQINGSIVSLANLNFINVVQLNLHNPATDIPNKYIDPNTGNLSDGSSWKASDFIPVTPGKTYTNSTTLYGVYYDANKAFVSAIPLATSVTYTVPDGVAYVRHTYNSTDYGVLCEGTSVVKSSAQYGEKNVTISDNDFLNAVGTNLVTKRKKALIFGDSVTQTHNVSSDGLTFTFSRNNWPTYAMANLGITSYKNFATDGAAYRDRTGLTFYQLLSNQISMAISTVPTTEADIIIVSAGTNDYVNNLGDYATAMSKTSLDTLDRTNLYEAVRWAFWNLRKNYPNAVFYVGIPIQRADHSLDDVAPMVNTIKTMAKLYNFIVIDGEGESGIVREFETWQAQGRFLQDGLHPDDVNGRKLLSKLYTRVIKNTYMG